MELRRTLAFVTISQHTVTHMHCTAVPLEYALPEQPKRKHDALIGTRMAALPNKLELVEFSWPHGTRGRKSQKLRTEKLGKARYLCTGQNMRNRSLRRCHLQSSEPSTMRLTTRWVCRRPLGQLKSRDARMMQAGGTNTHLLQVPLSTLGGSRPDSHTPIEPQLLQEDFRLLALLKAFCYSATRRYY